MWLLGALFTAAAVAIVMLRRTLQYIWKRKPVENKSTPPNTSSKIKLVIYDFDQTLSCTHVWNATKGCRVDRLTEVPDAEFISYFESPERVTRLANHLKLLQRRGVKYRILSHGWEDVILGCFERLAKMELMQPGLIEQQDIVGREMLREFQSSKQLCIRQWMDELGYAADEVIFVDDDPVNIHSVQSSMTCETYQVEGQGLTLEDLSLLEAKLEGGPGAC